MIKKLTSAILFLQLLGLMSYAQRYRFEPTYKTLLDTVKGRLVLNQCSRAVPQASSFFEVGNEDQAKLVNNFRKILIEKADGCCIVNAQIKSLKRYAYQFLGVIINNKKYIYINAFSFEKDDLKTYLKNWKTEPIDMCDGGLGAWGVLFEIETQSFSQLSVNGIA